MTSISEDLVLWPPLGADTMELLPTCYVPRLLQLHSSQSSSITFLESHSSSLLEVRSEVLTLPPQTPGFNS